MKKGNVITMIVSIISLACNAAFGQGSATASVSSNVVMPIGLVKTVDMNFGNAATSAIAGGAIILAPAGTRSTTGIGVTLPAMTGTVAAATFTVSGAPGYTYSITLPSTATISGPGTTSMTVNGFTSVPGVTGTLSSGGTQTLSVGATLQIAAAQAPGIYTNATAVPVTVNYN